jgi:hypothetical protein
MKNVFFGSFAIIVNAFEARTTVQFRHPRHRHYLYTSMIVDTVSFFLAISINLVLVEFELVLELVA